MLFDFGFQHVRFSRKMSFACTGAVLPLLDVLVVWDRGFQGVWCIRQLSGAYLRILLLLSAVVPTCQSGGP